MSTLFTVDEVAGQLRLRPLTIYRAVKSGKLEALRIGRVIRITPEQLEAFTQKRTTVAKETHAGSS